MEETHRKPKGNEIELERNDDNDDDNANNMGMMSAFGHAMHDVWEHIPGHEYAESILGFRQDDENFRIPSGRRGRTRGRGRG